MTGQIWEEGGGRAEGHQDPPAPWAGRIQLGLPSHTTPGRGGGLGTAGRPGNNSTAPGCPRNSPGKLRCREEVWGGAHTQDLIFAALRTVLRGTDMCQALLISEKDRPSPSPQGRESSCRSKRGPEAGVAEEARTHSRGLPGRADRCRWEQCGSEDRPRKWHWSRNLKMRPWDLKDSS